jgi:SOS-response transcriptional repressor LexA
MRITEEIREAVRKAADDSGNIYQLSKKLGIAHSTILFWLDGKTSKISGDVWYEKVLPALRAYLPYGGGGDEAGPSAGVKETGGYAAEARPAQTDELHEVPVISFAQAAAYDPPLEPFDCFLKDCSHESTSFSTPKKDGYFALRVDGDSMSPTLPDGSVIYVAGGEFPERGDLVTAKIRGSGQVVVKKYFRKNNLVTLQSINPAGQTFEWNCKENPDFLAWMWPVIEYTVKARKQRWERMRFGKK